MRWVIVLLVALILGGCIAVPLPYGKGDLLEGKVITAGQFQFLLDPATQKEEVLKELGPPRMIWTKEDVFVYN